MQEVAWPQPLTDPTLVFAPPPSATVETTPASLCLEAPLPRPLELLVDPPPLDPLLEEVTAPPELDAEPDEEPPDAARPLSPPPPELLSPGATKPGWGLPGALHPVVPIKTASAIQHEPSANLVSRAIAERSSSIRLATSRNGPEPLRGPT
jgi:hypothetical protein